MDLLAPFVRFVEDLGTNPFLGTGLAAGLLASLACGLIGPYVVTRRIVFLAGAVAHIAVGGVGAAIWLAAVHPDLLPWLRPIHGAALAAVLAALLLAWVHERAAERLDTLIGALWASGMAVGLLLLKLTPGYQTEIMGYLFGNIVFVPRQDVMLMAGLDLVIVAVVLVFHKRLLAVCVDPEQARLQGVGVLATNALLLVLVALTVILLTQVVGLILVIALLALPAAAAGHLVGRIGPMMLVATLFAAVVTTLPRMAVYGSRTSPEPAIVLAAAVLYGGAVLGGRWLRGRRRSGAAPEPVR